MSGYHPPFSTTPSIINRVVEIGVTVAELVELLGTSRRTIERNIKYLQEAGKLQRVGATKKGGWQVI